MPHPCALRPADPKDIPVLVRHHRRMFEEIDADVYIMVDGDDTYPADEAGKLIQPIIDEEADMVVATRLEQADKNSFSFSHKFGEVPVNELEIRLFLFFFRKILFEVLREHREKSGNCNKNCYVHVSDKPGELAVLIGVNVSCSDTERQ